MTFYKLENQIIFADKELSTGTILTPNTVDAAQEKHVPVVNIQNNEVTVKVGEVEHPSLDAHYIEFILLETTTGIHTKWGKPGMTPAATFILAPGETALAAYEYCNLHGLWKATI